MKIFETEEQGMWYAEGDRYDDVSIKFSMRSNDLSIENVSKNLGLDCTRGFERGDEFISKRTQRRGEKQWGTWCYESKHFVSSDKLTDHLDFILSVFEPRKGQLKAYLENEFYTVTVRIDFCESLAVASCGFNKETIVRIMSVCNNFEICLVTDYRDLTEDA